MQCFLWEATQRQCPSALWEHSPSTAVGLIEKIFTEIQHKTQFKMMDERSLTHTIEVGRDNLSSLWSQAPP